MASSKSVKILTIILCILSWWQGHYSEASTWASPYKVINMTFFESLSTRILISSDQRIIQHTLLM